MAYVDKETRYAEAEASLRRAFLTVPGAEGNLNKWLTQFWSMAKAFWPSGQPAPETYEYLDWRQDMVQRFVTDYALSEEEAIMLLAHGAVLCGAKPPKGLTITISQAAGKVLAVQAVAIDLCIPRKDTQVSVKQPAQVIKAPAPIPKRPAPVLKEVRTQPVLKKPDTVSVLKTREQPVASVKSPWPAQPAQIRSPRLRIYTRLPAKLLAEAEELFPGQGPTAVLELALARLVADKKAGKVS